MIELIYTLIFVPNLQLFLAQVNIKNIICLDCYTQSCVDDKIGFFNPFFSLTIKDPCLN